MAHEQINTELYVSGNSISFYIQKELEAELLEATAGHPEIYKSKSHFINCSIARELRRLKEENGTDKQEKGSSI